MLGSRRTTRWDRSRLREASDVLWGARVASGVGAVMTLPLGLWQAPSDALQPCERHRGLCQYRKGDPALCDRCHRPWATILGRDGESRDQHEHSHDMADRKSARGIARHRAKAAARGT